MRIPLSVLDLAPVSVGTSAAVAAQRTVELAQLADRLGFERYWFAEHHGLQAVASSAPEILIANAAAATRRIRVGSGGIMLPNHAPLRIAEAFRTLEALYPGRIDLGVGRAPGSNRNTGRALRAMDGEYFSALMSELLTLASAGYARGHPLHNVVAMPTGVALPPIWILGSSGASAASAGSAGMGYSFASHFSLAPPAPAFRAYRESFRPSEWFPSPHAILVVSAVCAETSERAEYLAATGDLMHLRIVRDEFPPLPSPEEALAYPYTEDEREIVRRNRGLHIVGTPEQVRARIGAMVDDTAADEVMIVSNLYDHDARLQSYRLLAEALAGSLTREVS